VGIYCILRQARSLINPRWLPEKAKGALVSESALHISMAVSRILSGRRGDRMIIYLTPLSRDARRACAHRDATIPEDSGPAVLPLFCLAPHGVFPASQIAPRAVSSYLAFSPLPVPLLPKNRRCLFCDTFRRRDFTTAVPAFFTRHVAVWCSDFPPASVAAYQRSSAIALNLSQSARKKTANYPDSSDRMNKIEPNFHSQDSVNSV
jgi:hypothetical protein